MKGEPEGAALPATKHSKLNSPSWQITRSVETEGASCEILMLPFCVLPWICPRLLWCLSYPYSFPSAIQNCYPELLLQVPRSFSLLLCPPPLSQARPSHPLPSSQALTFVPIIYFMIGFDPHPEQFFYYVIVFFETIAFYTIFGQTLVYITPAQAFAQVRVAGGFRYSLCSGCGWVQPYRERVVLGPGPSEEH